MKSNSLLKNGIIGHIIIVVIFILLANSLFFSGCRQKHEEIVNTIQNVEKPPEDPRIIRENTVIFLGISDTDYDSLISKTPQSAEQMSELISDFYYSAGRIARKLEPLGIIVKSETWTEMWFQVAEGQFDKVTFDPKNIYGMVLYAKGKAPKLVTKFYLQSSAMAKIISEYFNIEVED